MRLHNIQNGLGEAELTESGGPVDTVSKGLMTAFRQSVEWIHYVFRGDFHRMIVRALRVRPRGGIRGDGLRLTHVSGQLQVEWQARDVHPWDRCVPRDRQRELVADQLFEDTERALTRLFSALPEIDAISIRVLGPCESHRIVLEGTALRRNLDVARSCQSRRMRLSLLGIRYEPESKGGIA